MLLSAIDAYRDSLGVGPDPVSQGCRDVALTSGPWWPFLDTALMSERPILLTLNQQGRLQGDDGPAVQWARRSPRVGERGRALLSAPHVPDRDRAANDPTRSR
ncbi:DUF6745 domain-containing protein [Micromonospora sp. NPDC005173]|uniref:DUF6745 domain-containing protein n=1 Tax=Micromonospora sp. NPDC005173 TaxID=3157165 RepID=UPI0033A72BCC